AKSRNARKVGATLSLAQRRRAFPFPPSARHSVSTTSTAALCSPRTFCRPSAITSGPTLTNVWINPAASSPTPTGPAGAERRPPALTPSAEEGTTLQSGPPTRWAATRWVPRVTDADKQRSGYTLAILRKKPGGAWVIARDANLLTA